MDTNIICSERLCEVNEAPGCQLYEPEIFMEVIVGIGRLANQPVEKWSCVRCLWHLYRYQQWRIGRFSKEEEETRPMRVCQFQLVEKCEAEKPDRKLKVRLNRKNTELFICRFCYAHVMTNEIGIVHPDCLPKPPSI